jgi:hypothetical protein
MLYIKESLSPGEYILRPAVYHGIYLLRAGLWVLVYLALAMFLLWCGAVFYYAQGSADPAKLQQTWQLMNTTYFVKAVWHTSLPWRLAAFMMLLVGLVHFSGAVMISKTVEMAVTNRRLILKTGLISRNIDELPVENIEAVEVSQSIMGRLLGYGQIHAHGTGEGKIFFPPYIADVVGFRRAIQHARSALEVQRQQAYHMSNTPNDLVHPAYNPDVGG